MPWPELPGSFVPAKRSQTAEAALPAGPTWTQEVIGSEEAGSAPLDQTAIDSFLNGLKETFEAGPQHGKGEPSLPFR